MAPKAAMKKSILDMRNQIPKQQYEIPGLSDKVWVYGLTARELAEYREHVRDAQLMDPRLAAGKIIQLALRDDAGLRIFGETDVLQISELPAHITEPLVELVMELSGWGSTALETIAKNSQTIPGADGLSAQPGSINAASASCCNDTQRTSSANSTPQKHTGLPESPETPSGS